MFCSKCGSQLTDDSRFCGVCGTMVAPLNNEPANSSLQNAVSADDSETVLMSAPVEHNDATVFAAAVAPQSVPAEPSDATVFASAATPQGSPEQMPFPQPSPLFAQTAAYQPQSNAPVQPVQQAPMQNPYSGAPSAPVKKRVSKGVVALVCILFGLLIFVIGLAAGVAESVRSTLDKGLISDEVKNVDILDVVIGDILLSDELVDDISELMADYDRDIGDIDESTTVSEFVIILAKKDSVTEKDLKKIIKDTTFMDYISRVVASYEDYLLEDKDGKVVSVKEIEKLVDNNIDDVEEILDTVFRIDEDELDDTLQENEDILDDANPQNALDGIGSVSSLVLSPVVIIAAAAVAVLLAVLVAVICRSVSASMLTFGICSVLIGGVMMAVCVMKSVIVDAIGLSYSVVSDIAFDLLDNTLLGEMMKYGLIIAGVGVLMIIVAVIIKVASASVRAKAIN